MDLESQLRDPNDTAEEAPCWIVWEAANDGGRPLLRAIDTTEARAIQHGAYLRNCARVEGKPLPNILIEESRLNHLYAANLIAAMIRKHERDRKAGR
jgi:hypothetical protein